MSEPRHVKLAREWLAELDDIREPSPIEELTANQCRTILSQHARITELEGQLKVLMLRPVHPPFANVQTAYEAYAEMRAERDDFGRRNATLESALTEALDGWEFYLAPIQGPQEVARQRVAELRKLTEEK